MSSRRGPCSRALDPGGWSRGHGGDTAADTKGRRRHLQARHSEGSPSRIRGGAMPRQSMGAAASPAVHMAGSSRSPIGCSSAAARCWRSERWSSFASESARSGSVHISSRSVSFPKTTSCCVCEAPEDRRVFEQLLSDRTIVPFLFSEESPVADSSINEVVSDAAAHGVCGRSHRRHLPEAGLDKADNAAKIRGQLAGVSTSPRPSMVAIPM
jgi:hypothetical protein